MTKDRINRFCGSLVILMSGLALTIVLVVLTTGWERNLKDEGAAAHLFQILVLGQFPFLAGFIATIERARMKRAIRFGALAFFELVLAFGGVALFHL